MSDTDCINVCLATDKNYLQFAGAVIASILKNAAHNDNLVFYILQDSLEDIDRNKLIELNKIKQCEFRFITPDFSNLPNGKFLKYITRASLLRLQLPDLLPDVERIIYLDCDVIVMTSLRELWETPTGKAIGAGAADYNSGLSDHQKSIGCNELTYINSGVFVFNLEIARKENITVKFLETANDLKERATLLDQDIINVTLGEKRHILPLKWNLATGYFKRQYDVQYYSEQEIAEAVNEPGILHFSGKKKPWKWRRCRHAFWFEYFNAIKNTPWHKDYLKGLLKKVLYPYSQGTGPAAKAFRDTQT